MISKILRLLCYIRELALMLFFLPISAICKAIVPKYRDLWLICERGNDARDNGYWFYRYLRMEHPELNARYVISADSPDITRISELGGAVDYRSFSHYLMYYSARYLAGTHVQPCAPDLILYYHLAQKGIGSGAKQIFLQHGITQNDMNWLHGDNLKVDMFACGAKPEYEHIDRNFGFPKGVARYVGMCRFDNLVRNAEQDKMILVMPTWRGSKYPGGPDFVKTEYHKAFQTLLASSTIIELLEKYDYRMVFYPHVEMQKYNSTFSAGSCRISVEDKSTCDVQKLLLECSLLITDYSSVFFDVAFLEKPIIYYQFDEEDFRKYHYQKGYFDTRRDGFGPVCATENDVCRELQSSFENGMEMQPEYLRRVKDFFPMRDDRNCLRTYEAICRL